jgi:hypothetical protein
MTCAPAGTLRAAIATVVRVGRPCTAVDLTTMRTANAE